MVALKGRDIDAFLARPDAGRPIILLYGPDAGLVRERADALIASAVDDPNDPFSLVKLDGDELSAEPSRLVDQPRRFGGEFIAVEPDQRKRIVGIVDRRRQQGVGTLAHQAGIGTVEQDDGAAGIGPGEKSVDVSSLERDHIKLIFLEGHFQGTLCVTGNDRSGAGDEERRQPGLDVFRDLLGGAILGIAEGALARKALQ